MKRSAKDKFSIGDKVRFLNEKGEGIVTGFTKDGRVNVELDGFDIPFHASELVSIAGEKPVERARQYVKPAEEDSRESFKVTDTVYIAYELLHLSDPDSSPLQIWLINNTPWQILFSFGKHEDGLYKGLEKGSIDPSEKFDLRKIERHEIPDFASFRIQLLFHSQGPLPEKMPINELVKVKQARFYKSGTYLSSNLTKNPAIIIDLLDISGDHETIVQQEIWKGEGVKITNIAEHIYTKERGELPRMSAPHITRTGALEKEVDLHIEELLDSVRGMSNTEILKVQIAHFHRELEDAIARKMKKVVFIHGIGNGVLKTEIRRLLADYDGVKYFDAAYSRYGYGATEVEIY